MELHVRVQHAAKGNVVQEHCLTLITERESNSKVGQIFKQKTKETSLT
jgi:hypothetical protein